MTALPANAPFPPDAIAALNSVIGATSPTQRSWLSGFLAGVEAATAAPAVAAAPVVRPALTVLFATESGNSEALARRAAKDAGRLGFAARVLDAADATPADLAKARNLLVIASTWGEGEPPQRATGLLGALMADAAPRMEGVNYAVLALGDRAYAQFCETGRVLDDRLAALGARRAAPRIDLDLDYEAPAAAWLATTLKEFRGEQDAPAAASVIHVDFGHAAAPEYGKANPFQAEITDLVNLNSSRSAKQTFHVELSLNGSGLTYEPGDAIGVLPHNDPAAVDAVLSAAGLSGDAALHAALTEKHDISTLTGHLVRGLADLTGDKKLAALAGDAGALAAFLPGRHVVDLLEAHPNTLTAQQLTGLLRSLPPRLYSVASSQKLVGEEAHLLISAVRYQAHGRDRAGVASTHIADRCRVGDSLPLYVKPNAHFRLPADPAVPVIMIGPGTGVAPFRAFMQERDALGTEGRSWLFFGDRQYTHDFLYQLEWQDLLARGLLTRLDLAFSRDQDAKSYVQHRLWDQRRDLHAWMQDGAHVYVCGDQARMAKDVHAMLRDVIADQGAITAEAAEAQLDGMKRTGRYLLDVY
jgi:sulfite reductase (NADPH) flavoprotein alpha-component